MKKLLWIVLTAVFGWIVTEIIHAVLNRHAGPVCYYAVSRDLPGFSTLCRWMGREIIKVPPLPNVVGPTGDRTKPSQMPTTVRSKIEQRCTNPLIAYDGEQLAYSKETRASLQRCVLSCISSSDRQLKIAASIFQWIELSSTAVSQTCAGRSRKVLSATAVVEGIRLRYQALNVSGIPTDLQHRCTQALHSVLRQTDHLQRLLERTSLDPSCIEPQGAPLPEEVEQTAKSLTQKSF